MVWALGFLSLSVSAASAQEAQVIAEGKAEYQRHCQACHGESGAGDGPMAEILVLAPADLTAIAKANGGSFPFWRVYRAVDGSQAVSGHQTFQMPGYWSRFRGDEGKPGYAPAHIRILLLTHYLDSIQDE